MSKIYHIAQQDEWAQAKLSGEYWPSGSVNCPFIHFSFSSQVIRIANLLFKGRNDLVLLEVDAKRVETELKVEANEPDTEKFPHLYRRLRVEEVRAVHQLQPSMDGSFIEQDF